MHVHVGRDFIEMCVVLFQIRAADSCMKDVFVSVENEDAIRAFFARFDEEFFKFCEKELARINTFFSGTIYNVIQLIKRSF